MPKPFAAFDVDGTIYKSSLAEVVIDESIQDGLFDVNAFASAREYRNRWQLNNNEGIYQAYLHHLVGTFTAQMAGVEVEEFNRVTQQVLAKHAVRRFGFPRQLMQVLQPTHFTVAISGSPELLVHPFLADLAVNAVYGAQFEVVDGKFTGEAVPVGNKATVLERLIGDGFVRWGGSVALGDTISDASMIASAEYPIMFNASRTLTNFGVTRHWTRVNEVKDQVTALVYDPHNDRYIEQDVAEFMATLVA